MSSTSFVLKSVAVENWKTFTSATFNVESEGLTGIVGANGSGKSSLLDAILWCLYGKQPAGVTKGALRRRKADPKKETTRVTVVFTHAGQTIEVFREMSGKNHTVKAGLFLDGQEVVVHTGGTTETWITNRLGMDVQGFRTAVVVPQKELDSLVDATASVRREHIEKLAGIEEMNLAVKKAREEQNDLAKKINVLPGSIEQVEEAGAFAESLSHDLEEIVDLLEQSTADSDRLEQTLAKITEEGSQSSKTLKEAQTIHQQISEAHHTAELTRSKITDLEQRISAIDEDIAGIDVSERESLTAQYREVNEKYTTLGREIANHDNNVTQANNNITSITNTIKDRSAKNDRLTVDLKTTEDVIASLGALETLQARKEGLDKVIESEMARSSSLDYVITERQKSIDILGTHDHTEAKCPTCQSTLDNPDKLLAQFEENIKQAVSEKEELSPSIEDNKNQLGQVVENINTLQTSGKKVTSIAKEISALETEIAHLQDDLKTAEAELASLNDFDMSNAQEQLEELDQKKQKIVSRGEKIAAAEKAITNRDALISQKAELDTKLNDAVESQSTLESKLDTYGDLSELEMTVQQFTENIENARNEYNTAFRLMKDQESQKATISERFKAAQDVLTREEELAKAKSTALETLESKSAVSDLLDEYRKERIARIAPELSATATDLISQMTNGRFVEVIVYEDFATGVVKDDGEEYAVAELSGGEKSVVALALRIAIGSLITGENSGLLWLDEVLPAQDAERRDAILNVLRSLPIQQIVMINHTHEAEDVVDRVVNISYDGVGSTIEE